MAQSTSSHVTWLSKFNTVDRMSMFQFKIHISASMLRSIEQLQHLEIHDCISLEEIIYVEGADKVNPCFIFQRLTSLRLLRLPELRCLYPRMHTSKWPSLKTLQVCSCDKMKTFASELSSSGGNIDSSQLRISMQEPLFFEEKVWIHFLRLSVALYVGVSIQLDVLTIEKLGKS